MNLSRLSPARIARSLVTVLVLTLIQSVVEPVLNIAVPEARAATLYDNRSNFQQWTTWQSVSTNHLPYKTSAGTDVITSNTDAINLTQDAGSQVGFLWNTQVFSYAQDLTVSANYYFGAKDGADGIVFSMRPLDQWPNDGVAGSSTGGVTYWATGELRVIFDTYQNGIEMADDHLRVIAVTNAGANTEYNPSGTALKNGSGTTVSDVETDAYFPFTVKWTAASRTIAVYSGLTANHLIYSTTVSASALDATQFSWGWMGFTGGASNFQAISSVNYHVSPTVSTTATDTTVTDGDQVTFTASYTSTESSPTTRWEYSTDGGSTWISTESTTSTYTFTATRAFTQRKYRFLVYSTAVGATYTNATTPVTLTVNPPPLGRDTDTALYFDGTDYVKVADSSEVDFTNAFTFQAWVKPETMTSYGMILNKEDSVEFYISGGYYGIAAQKALNQWGYFQTGVPATIGEWHHIAYTRAANSSTVSVYLDGNLAWSGVIDADFTGAPLNTSYPLMIGGRSGSGSGTTFDPSFKGLIDHVAVYSSVRTQSQIQSDMKNYISPTASDLLLYYDFNEGQGTTLYNRKSGSTSASDLLFAPTSPTWTDVNEVSTPANSPYTIVKFPRTYITVNGGWRVPSNVSRVSALVVAGGGAGGSRVGGGGGAGGYVYMGVVTLSSNSIETITVGQGGIGVADYAGKNGFDSALGSRLIAIGGGGGGASNSNGERTGRAGGSGGGSGDSSNSAGASTQASLGTATGLGNSGANGQGGGNWSAGGGGGAVAAGFNGTDATYPGWGGTGKVESITGTAVCYAAGGGGGIYGASTGTRNNGGRCAGLTATGGSGTISNTVGLNAVANTGSGGGGAGYLDNNAGSDRAGGNGGSGVIIIRWITASVPTYTKPTNAYLNVGMTETFTTNVAQDSATAVLTRTFKWESTTPSAGGVYTLLKQGTGAENASFSWVPTDTSTSGSGYLYRLTVTDSDTAGLFITDSSTAFAVINRALVVSGTSTVAKTINVSKNETFTITLGTPTYRASLSPVIPGITIDTATAGLAIVRIAETMTVGTYYETLTVTDSVSASIVTPLTIVVAAPPQLSNTSEIVNDGLVFNFDASSSASFNFATGAMSDISGAMKPITRVNTNAYSPENLGVLTFNSTSDSGPYAYFNKSVQMPRFTVETYVRLNGTSVTDHFCPMVSEYTTGVIGFALCIDAGRTFYAGFRSATAWTYKRSQAVIPMNTWTHLVGTFDGTEIRIYLNGNLVTSYASTNGFSTAGGTDPFVPTTDKVYINRDYSTAAAVTPGNTSYGFLRLYNIGFTQTEVTRNLNATKNRFIASSADALTPSHKYGNTTTETFTTTSGYGADSFAFTVGNKAGVKLETATSIVTLKMQESLTATTHYETITVTDSLGASTYLPIKMTVSKADTLTISMDTATAVNFNKSPITVYPKPVFRGLVGSDTLTVTTKFSSQLYALSATVPTNADTYTVIAADPVFTFGAASNYQAIVYETSTAVVRKIAQRPLGIFMYGGVVGSPFLISLSGGDGDGVVTETLTGVSSIPGCAISNHYLTSSATVQGFCEVLVVKAASQNYFSESQTAQLYFMAFINNQPTGQIGSGSTIAINGATSLSKDLNAPPVITSLSSTSISLSSQGEFWINGSGFSNGGLRVTFWDEVDVSPKSVTDSKITFDISAIAAEGATSGRIAVRTVKGPVVSIDTLVINP